MEYTRRSKSGVDGLVFVPAQDTQKIRSSDRIREIFFTSYLRITLSFKYYTDFILNYLRILMVDTSFLTQNKTNPSYVVW